MPFGIRVLYIKNGQRDTLAYGGGNPSAIRMRGPAGPQIPTPHLSSLGFASARTPSPSKGEGK